MKNNYKKEKKEININEPKLVFKNKIIFRHIMFGFLTGKLAKYLFICVKVTED